MLVSGDILLAQGHVEPCCGDACLPSRHESLELVLIFNVPSLDLQRNNSKVVLPDF